MFNQWGIDLLLKVKPCLKKQVRTGIIFSKWKNCQKFGNHNAPSIIWLVNNVMNKQNLLKTC